jgi:hypothetical protein
MLHVINQIVGGYNADENQKRSLVVYESLFGTRAGQRSPPVITFDQIKWEIPYIPGLKLIRPRSVQRDPKTGKIIKSLDNHNGQLKLLLAEMQILLHARAKKIKVFVYAGAAPNNKGALLAALFPDMKIIMVDPANFQVLHPEQYNVSVRMWYSHDRDDSRVGSASVSMTAEDIDNILTGIKNSNCNINIIRDYMTPALARGIREKFGDVIFMSDIRTNVHTPDVRDMKNVEENPDAVDVIWNTAQMLIWMAEMLPAVTSIKWRFPFYQEELDYVLKELEAPFRKGDIDAALGLGFDLVQDLKDRKMHFYPGKIYLQAFPGSSSTEGRLVVVKEDIGKIHDYGDATASDDKYNYYNSIERPFVLHPHMYTNRQKGFDMCNDCAIMASILQDYLTRYNKSPDFVDWFLDEVKKTTGRHLFIGGHGRFFSPYTAEQIQHLAKLRDELMTVPKFKK